MQNLQNSTTIHNYEYKMMSVVEATPLNPLHLFCVSNKKRQFSTSRNAKERLLQTITVGHCLLLTWLNFDIVFLQNCKYKYIFLSCHWQSIGVTCNGCPRRWELILVTGWNLIQFQKSWLLHTPGHNVQTNKHITFTRYYNNRRRIHYLLFDLDNTHHMTHISVFSFYRQVTLRSMSLVEYNADLLW